MQAPGFTVRSHRVGPAFDLLAGYGGVFMERSGSGVAGTGVAFRVGFNLEGRGAAEMTSVVDAFLSGVRRADDDPAAPAPIALSGIRRADDDPAAPAPIAFGSIPFERSRTVTLTIPARTIRRDRGEAWALDVSPAWEPPLSAEGRRVLGSFEPSPAFGAMQLRTRPSSDAYVRGVADAVARIRAGELRKVVLARTVEVAAGRRLDPAQLLRRLRAVDPDCYAFAVDTGARAPSRDRVLVGASPELLVSRFGREVRSTPLAGSAPRFGDPDRDRESGEGLLASPKEREEHALVVEAVEVSLDPFCDELDRDPEPILLPTANVWHLSTRFRGTLKEPAADALTLAAALHPTPAVCGVPRDAARALIRELEPFERDGYGGPVGWVDANGDGEWAIALRCAELRGDVARLFAGAGIVADSEPERELDETERKFRAFLDSLRWG